MKVDSKFKGKVVYFKEMPGAAWKQLLCVPSGTTNADALVQSKQDEFRSAYPNVEFKEETK